MATNFSRLVARLALEIFVTFFEKTYTNDIPLSKVKYSKVKVKRYTDQPLAAKNQSLERLGKPLER